MDQRIVCFERIIRFMKAKTDYSLKADYYLVRFETDLFLQQAPEFKFALNSNLFAINRALNPLSKDITQVQETQVICQQTTYLHNI